MYLDYSVSSGPFLSFSLRFEFHSEISVHSVCETRDLSLTILMKVLINVNSDEGGDEGGCEDGDECGND